MAYFVLTATLAQKATPQTAAALCVIGSKEVDQRKMDQGIDLIWTRYRNCKFVVGAAAIASVLSAVIPVIFAPVAIILFIFSFYVLWRYFETICPNCGEKFTSLWFTLLFFFREPSKCRNCGTTAKNSEERQ